MKNVAIDSDVFVASEIDTEKNHKESKKFIEYILKYDLKDISLYTSIFTFLELGSAMIRRTKNKDKAYSLLYRVGKSWKNKINPLPLSPEKKQISVSHFSKDWVDGLIETSIRFNTKSGDTIQSQCIVDNKIDCFITWNKKDFSELEKQIEGFKVFTPTEVLSELEKAREKIISSPKDYTGWIEAISEKLQISIKDVEKRIEARRAKLSGLISKEGAVQIIASEAGLKIR